MLNITNLKTATSTFVVGSLLLGGLVLAPLTSATNSQVSLSGDATTTRDNNRKVFELSSTATTFSGIDVAFTGRRVIQFEDIRKLMAEYKITVGDCHGGSPRFQINIDTNGDGTPDKNIFVYIGPHPSFSGCTAGSWQSTGNLINDPDARYDLTQLGGPFYGTHQDALNIAGSYRVTGTQLVLDGGWGGDQTFLFRRVFVHNVLANPVSF